MLLQCDNPATLAAPAAGAREDATQLVCYCDNGMSLATQRLSAAVPARMYARPESDESIYREERDRMASKQDQMTELQKKNLEAAMRLAQMSIEKFAAHHGDPGQRRQAPV